MNHQKSQITIFHLLWVYFGMYCTVLHLYYWERKKSSCQSNPPTTKNLLGLTQTWINMYFITNFEKSALSRLVKCTNWISHFKRLWKQIIFCENPPHFFCVKEHQKYINSEINIARNPAYFSRGYKTQRLRNHGYLSYIFP